MPTTDPEVAIDEALKEMDRLRRLSNQDLVVEYLRLTGEQDSELHVNEMCSRLWPEWDTEVAEELIRIAGEI